MKKKLFLTIIFLSSLSQVNANWFTDYAKSFGNTVAGYASDTYEYVTGGKSTAELLKQAEKDVNIAVDRAKVAAQIAQDYALPIITGNKILNATMEEVKYATEQVAIASNYAVEKAREYADILASSSATQAAKDYAKIAFESANEKVMKLQKLAENALQKEKDLAAKNK